MELEGFSAIVAVGNGDAASHEPFQAKQRKAFNGICQVILKATAGKPGKMVLKAHSEGLAAASVAILATDKSSNNPVL